MNASMLDPCAECGGLREPATCRELFDHLLALEFSQREPWGPLHALTVATYALQHPSFSPVTPRDGYWSILELYCEHGMQSLERGLRARRGIGLPKVSRVPAWPVAGHPGWLTLADVATPGPEIFPAEGHVARVDAWLRSVRSTIQAAARIRRPPA